MELTWKDIDEICHIYELLRSMNPQVEYNEDFYDDILTEYLRRKKLES